MQFRSFSDQGLAAHRKAVLQALLVFIVVCGVIFTVFNIHVGNTPLATAEIITSVYALILLLIVHRARRLGFWTYACVLPFYAVLLFALSTPLAGPSVFVWVLIIPVLSHLLLGRWQGSVVAGIYMAGAVLVFVWKYGLPDLDTGTEVILNVMLCGACIFGLSHVHETSRAAAERELQRVAMADPLTGLANRARFRQAFAAELSRYQREKVPFSIAILDLDYFKQINDNYGHDAGDAVLVSVARIIQDAIRPSDVVGRLGGEEFGIILVSMRSRDAGIKTEAIRSKLEAAVINHKSQDISITASVGVACTGHDGEDFESLFSVADERLYRAKAAGRNRIVA